jgi:hypothetical protein
MEETNPFSSGQTIMANSMEKAQLTTGVFSRLKVSSKKSGR